MPSSSISDPDGPNQAYRLRQDADLRDLSALCYNALWFCPLCGTPWPMGHGPHVHQVNAMAIRVEVRGEHHAAVRSLLQGASALGIHSLTDCRIIQLYFLAGDLDAAAVDRLCAVLLADPVTQTASWMQPSAAQLAPAGGHVVEVSFRPGVTDVAARELARGMSEIGLPTCSVATATRYELHGDLDPAQLRRLARQLLSNDTVQHFSLGPITPHFSSETGATDRVEIVPLAGLDDDQMVALSRARLLSLDAGEMRAIQRFFADLGRSPTDVELETLAQTWSEHCVHKTFRASIDYTWLDSAGDLIHAEQIDGLLRQYIRAATEAVRPDWLRSAFVDNAGIIAFDDAYDLAFKVETHNHPSALEPFGGANTGVGGVVRDILGVSARPIATTDVLCFGPQDLPHDALPPGILHPRRIASGVVAGIGDYGNKLGLPTANGAVIYDVGYLGNPLVFCGCAGLLPIGRHPTQALIGDTVVVLGGRTGRDGLHGATFSSVELTHETSETAGSAVQIGDPITEKGLIELIEAARDRGLYHAITDCGAGGLSSAIGEMGETLGVDVELTRVLLKYPGLVPWEIWLSEAQERMVLAVPPAALPDLEDLARLWDVELSVLGTFSGDAQLRVRYAGTVVADLPMSFLHDGLPQRHLAAVYREPAVPADVPALAEDADAILMRMLAHPTIASKENIVRRYDHEVRGGTIVRPFVGPYMDGPGDAAVLKPLGTWQHDTGFALSVGINPNIGCRDPYAMAVSAVDEAFRNAVAVGADPDRVALLDNFCWGNPTLPDRLGALVRACQGCHDAAVAYRAPFISGKDSLYNEFNGKPIPGTLLISAIGIVPDIQAAVTSDLKQPGDRLYLLGESKAELGGSLLHSLYGKTGGAPPSPVARPLDRYRLLHRAIRAGYIQACHDLSEGGLAVALAEMALGGRLGVSVQLPESDLDIVAWLFGESNGRLLLEVTPDDAATVEDAFSGETLIQLGSVTDEPFIKIQHASQLAVNVTIATIREAWLSPGR